MFDEGLKIHSAEYLMQVSREFQAGHWVRLVASGIASILGFIGWDKFYRQNRSNNIRTYAVEELVLILKPKLIPNE
jgi:hypothetical protein